MEGPLKKRKKIPDYLNYDMIFKYVLPYLFPGQYDEDWKLAFWTYFALAGTCRKLRYWYFLRRWIGFLCPESHREALLSHGFPVFIAIEYGREVQLHFLRLLRRKSIVAPDDQINGMTQFMLNNWTPNTEDNGGMEKIFADIPLYNLIRITVHPKRGERDSEVLCFYAQDFSELALAAYAICEEAEQDVNVTYLLYPSWKVGEKFPYIMFHEHEKKRFRSTHLLGRLRTLGMTAPYDECFTIGTAPHTAYTWFCELCTTSGQRSKKSPAQRLETFVASWFEKEFYIRENRKLPWNFSMEFVDGGADKAN